MSYNITFNVRSQIDGNGIWFNIFTVTDNNNAIIYERHYGQTQGSIADYIDDYHRYMGSGISYTSSSTDCNTTDTEH